MNSSLRFIELRSAEFPDIYLSFAIYPGWHAGVFYDWLNADGSWHGGQVNSKPVSREAAAAAIWRARAHPNFSVTRRVLAKF